MLARVYGSTTSVLALVDHPLGLALKAGQRPWLDQFDAGVDLNVVRSLLAILSRSTSILAMSSTKPSGFSSTFTVISSNAPVRSTMIWNSFPSWGIDNSAYSICDGNTLMPRMISMSSDLPLIRPILGCVRPQAQVSSCSVVMSPVR